MTTLSKTLMAAAALDGDRNICVLAGPLGIQSGLAYMYSGPGKMTAMAMASGARQLPVLHGQWPTVFDAGTLDPTGDFYRP